MMTFEVPDMTCGHCATTVEKAIKTADPHANAKIDLATKIVSVDTQLSSEAVLSSIVDAGYSPSIKG